ncbi:hypothetical protein WH95_06270 [Kiloniella litopenaei]|uniref:Bacteriophage T5 Orf172 DNA-binding domain-containing protein n=1 Tax=Kiloniella litopenaei TaxID=1549748 RepID=A0A0M2R8J7_9PROT|nr:GIY-YIG nuclease family protein [Kiloniella litopenaei]KKJ78006.1 hypothetical protein WH95_06270 [Kiloniella litopenaei]
MAELSDLELLDALGVEAKEEKKKKRTPKEERIIAGFEEIQKFVDDNGRLPAHGEGNDIFERLYATRLDQIRKQAECRDLVTELDHQGLLDGASEPVEEIPTDIDDDALLAELGVEAKTDDVTVLKHVKTRAEKRMVEEMANRTKCEDFDKFKPLFEAIQNDLDNGNRETKKFRKDAGFSKTDIKAGQFFILGGQTAYIAKVGEEFTAPNGQPDARMRVIYSNGTESDLLLRSMQRALYKDETSRIVSDPVAGPLFSGEAEADDLPSGTIYVLRSKSEDPYVSERHEVLHKIGVTGGDVNKRIANAKHDATYLLADVEIVATYKLANINRKKMEKLLHKFFDAARLNIEIKDRFGNPVSPREWFLVPLFIIDEVVDKIKDGTISDYTYDLEQVKLVKSKKA